MLLLQRVFPDEFGWVKKWVLGDEVGSRNEAERGAWLMTEDVVIHQWGETCMDDWSYHALPFKILVDLLDSTKIVGMKAHYEQRALGQLEQVCAALSEFVLLLVCRTAEVWDSCTA